jgi:hypothetical protein
LDRKGLGSRKIRIDTRNAE